MAQLWEPSVLNLDYQYEEGRAVMCDGYDVDAVPSRDDVRKQVIDIVCEQLNVDRSKIDERARFVNDLGADSLDIVELVLEFENSIGIWNTNFPDEDSERILTVGNAVDYILWWRSGKNGKNPLDTVAA